MAKSASDKVVMTREGYEKLKAELVSLRSDGRSEVAAKLEEARAFGDLSENAEYHAAKEEQEKLENRILQLEYQLSKAQIVEAHDIDTSVVSLGTTVTLEDLDLKKTFVYTLGGEPRRQGRHGQARRRRGDGENAARRPPPQGHEDSAQVTAADIRKAGRESAPLFSVLCARRAFSRALWRTSV